MKSRQIALFAAALIAFATQIFAQQIPPPKDRNAPMTNEDVIQMTSLGLPDNFVISKIKAAKNVNFDTSPAGLKALQDAKVHELVVQAVISKQDAGRVDLPPRNGEAASATPAATADPNDPMAPHDSGLYLFKDGKMTPLDRGSFTGQKHTSTLKTMATQGLAKQHQKAELQGAHAATQISDTSPVFYFYFDKDDAGGTLLSMTPAPKTPKEYELVKLEEGKNDRLLETMEAGMGGANMNTISKFAVKFSFTKIGPGAYKITVDSPLAPGEYCFVAGGGQMGMMAGSNGVFDFGITGK